MHEQRIRRLASTLEVAEHFKDEVDLPAATSRAHKMTEVPDQFNMFSYYSPGVRDCGTVGCVAGFCVSLFAGEDWQGPQDAEMATAELLGVNLIVANKLCRPNHGQGIDGGDYVSYSPITPSQAAQAVLNLLDEEVLEGSKHPWHHLIDDKGEQICLS